MYSNEEIALVKRSEALARRLDECFSYYREYNIICGEMYDAILDLSILKNELHNPVNTREKEVSNYVDYMIDIVSNRLSKPFYSIVRDKKIERILI